jgi:tetratricopeptide (TPR) repeat protein
MENHLNTIADSARALYDRGLYRDALEKYDALVQSQVHESSLYFNLGNCYTRLGELGEAKVNFERAILYDPLNESARHNLDWVNLRISESNLQPQGELLHWISENMRSLLQPDYWTILSGCLIILSVFLLIVRRTKITAFTWRWPFTTTVLAIIMLIIAQISIPKSQRAIVIERSSIGYSEPSNQSNQVVMLNEGGSGMVIKEENNWSLIKFSNGRIAWFSSKDWENVLP